MELNAERGTPTLDRSAWVGLVASVPGVTATVARPSDWDRVEAALPGGGPRACCTTALRLVFDQARRSTVGRERGIAGALAIHDGEFGAGGAAP